MSDPNETQETAPFELETAQEKWIRENSEPADMTQFGWAPGEYEAEMERRPREEKTTLPTPWDATGPGVVHDTRWTPEIEDGIPRNPDTEKTPLPPCRPLKSIYYPYAKMKVDQSFAVEITGLNPVSARVYIINRSRLAATGAMKFSTRLESRPDGTTWLRVWRDK